MVTCAETGVCTACTGVHSRAPPRVTRVKADPSEIIAVDVPEWRIVDDATWFAVQEKFGKRKPIGARDRPVRCASMRQANVQGGVQMV